MPELDEELGQCGCCGCAPVPTYPTEPHGEYFDGAERACVWCLREYTPSEWGEMALSDDESREKSFRERMAEAHIDPQIGIGFVLLLYVLVALQYVVDGLSRVIDRDSTGGDSQ